MANIASLVAYLELNTVKFEQSLGNTSTMAENAMKRIEGAAGLAKIALGGLAGALSIGGIVNFVKNTIDATAKLKDLAENTNATVEQLSALAKIAKYSGQDMDAVVGGLQKLERQMVAAASGSKEAQKNFTTFGITAQEVKAKLDDPAAMMLLLAQRADGFNRSAVKTDAMMALMGKGGANLGKFMGELAQQTELVGNRTTEQAERAEKFEKALRRLGEGVDKVAKGFVIGLLPALEKALPLLKLAAELAALWFGAFVVGPKVLAAVTLAWAGLIGLVQTSTLYFAAATTTWEAMTTSLYGVSVASQVAAGGLAALMVVAGAAFAGFAGWKIGEYLSENFLEARLAGIALVEGLMKVWEYLKFGFEVAVEAMKTAWGTFIEWLGKGLAQVPGFGTAGGILEKLGRDQKGKGLGDLAAERDARIAADAAIFSDMADQAIASFNKLDGTQQRVKKNLGTPPDTAGMEKYRGELEALLNRLENTDAGVHAKFWVELKMLNKEFAAKDPERYARLVGELIKQTDYGKASMRASAEAAKANNEAFDAAFDAMEKERLATENNIKAWREKAEALEFETSTLALSSAEREKAIILHELEARKVGLSAEAYDQLRRRIEAALANRAALKESMEQQANFWKSIENVAHQTWNSIADGSKDLWRRVKDTAKNIFFDWLYQMTAKRWMINLVTSVSGVGVATQVFGAEAVKTASGGAGAASLGNSVYNLFNGGAGAMVGDALTWGGGQIGSNTLASFGIDMAIGNGVAGTIGTALPWIGAALAVAALFSEKSTPHVGGIGFSSGAGYTTPQGREAIGANYADPAVALGLGMMRSDWTKRWDQSSADALGTAAEGFAKTLNNILSGNGLAGGYSFGLAFSADGKDPARGHATITDAAGNIIGSYADKNDLGKDAGQAMQKYLGTEVPQMMLVALEAINLNDLADSYLDALNIESLSAEAATQALGFVDASDEIITAFEKVGFSASDVTYDLIKAMGGFDKAGAAINAMAQQLDVIAQAAATSSANFAASIRTVKLDVLDDPGKYDFLDQEAQKYRDVLATLTDQTLISQYAEKLNSTIMQGWGLLDDSQKQATSDKYIALLTQADELALSRFEAAKSEVTEQAREIAAAVKQAVQEAMAESTAASVTASNAVTTAVSNGIEARVTIDLGGGAAELGFVPG